MTLLTARYVAPVGGPVIEGGAVRIRSGRIVEVGTRDEMSAESVIDHGDAVICPGFVNAHTHLELSSLEGQVPPDPNFARWLGRLVSTVRGPTDEAGDSASKQRNDREEAVRHACSTQERLQVSVRDGIAASIRHGVTLVGDITANPRTVRPVLAASNLKCVSFGEVIAIGTQRGLLADRLNAALDVGDVCDRLRIGVSPHAPYTVEPDALDACARRATEARLPLCMHLAESRDEDEFTIAATGPLADHLKSLNVWDADIRGCGKRAVELVAGCGLLTNRTVIAHANYVSDADIELFASRQVSVALCPRTHDAFGHEPHRFAEMLRVGVNVCIGTDSLASNPSLSVLDELRFLFRTHEGMDAELLLAMGTVNGARALGWSDAAGTLRPGASADIVVVPIEQADRRAGVEAMFRAAAPPRAVYIAGVRQHSNRGGRM